MNKFNFNGRNFDYFKICLSNLILIILTLGLYYPIAKTKSNKYIFSSININNTNLNFNENIKQSYVIFFLYTLIYIALFASLFLLTKHASNPLFLALDIVFFFFFTIYFMAYASYKNSVNLLNSITYENKTFKTSLRFRNFIFITIKAIFITGLSLGFTAFTAIVIFVKTLNDIGIVSELLASDLSKSIYSFEMKIMILISITTFILTIFSFILGFSYYKLRLQTYILKNSVINKTKFKLKFKLYEYVLISVKNFIFIVFSLGFALPWTKLKLTQSILNNTKINQKSPTSE